MDQKLLDRYRSERGARAYSQKHHATWRRRLSNWREHQVVAQALFACGLGGDVLNIPCGTGRFGELLEERGFRVVGGDLSLPMLRTTTSARPWPLVAGSAFALPFKDQTFDGLFIMRLLHHVADLRERALLYREAARVSRRWVLLTYADYHTPKNLIREARAKWIKDRKPKITLTREQLQAEARPFGLQLQRVYFMAPLFTPLAIALFRTSTPNPSDRVPSEPDRTIPRISDSR
jgi:ubiquinone/menaquinone biosynthesis C-methylase UbiE